MMIDAKSPVGKDYENLLNDYVKQLNDAYGHRSSIYQDCEGTKGDSYFCLQ